MCQLNRADGFGKRSDLVYFDQNAIGNRFVDSALQASRVGDKQIVADQLNLVADLLSQQFPSVPVIFVKTVFDTTDWVLAGPVGQEVNHVAAAQVFVVDVVSAFVFVVKLSGCYVQGNLNLLARLVPRLLDRGHDQVKCFDVATEVWSESSFVTHGGVKAFALQDLF